jgi:hypothetical protein
MDGIISGMCPMAGFDISNVEYFGSATAALIIFVLTSSYLLSLC